VQRTAAPSTIQLSVIESRAMNKLIAVVLAVAVAAGAGWYLWLRDGAQRPGHVEVELVVAADAPLAFVPADTPFVFANLAPPPAEMVEHWERQMAQMADAWSAQFEMMRETFGSQGSDPRLTAVLDELEQILVGRSPREIGATLGIGFDAHAAIYGLGVVPVLRIELADPGALRDLVARLEAAAGEPLAQAEVDGQPYWLFGPGDGPFSGVAAIVDRHLVASLAPRDDPAALRQVFGLDRPRQSLADSGELQALNRQFGYSPFFSGYLHSVRLLDAVTGPASPLERALLAAAEAEKPVLDPTCAAEWRALAGAWPRWSIGYSQVGGQRIDTLSVLETRPTIAAALQKLRAPIPGLAAIGPDVVAHFGLGLRLGALPEVVSSFADAIRAEPWRCDSLAPLNEMAAQAQQQIANPALYATAPMVSAFHVALTELDLSDFDKPKFRGWLAFGSDNPAGLLGMGQMVAPQLATLQLSSDGTPQPLPANPAWPVDQPLHVAMGERALAISVGAGEERRLAAALAIDPARQPLLSGGVDSRVYQMIGEQIGKAAAAAPGQTPEQQARALRDAERMQRLYAAAFDRLDFRVEFTARGIEFSQQTLLH
jgi:hypothetical protein